jgi:hypothetical protein
MCKIYVSEGRMTQEDLDRANATGSDAADGSGRKAFPGLAADPAAFLAQLLGEPADPETEAVNRMDETARILLELVIQEDEKHGAPQSSVELLEACERDAARLMFTLKQSTVALSLTVFVRRYAILLERWAELYAKAAVGEDDTIDLDAATTAEARAAVTRATSPEHKTGMYL